MLYFKSRNGKKITWNEMQDIAIGDLKGIGNKQF